MKASAPVTEPMVFRPNWKAYFFLSLLTATLVAIYWVAARATGNLGSIGILEGPRWHYLLAEMIICSISWFYVTDNLLRHYEADDIGLTIYRPLLPTLRCSWAEVSGYTTYGYGDGFRLTVSGRGHITVMIECLRDGQRLASCIQRMAQQKSSRQRGKA
jgi:hypothetical protein